MLRWGFGFTGPLYWVRVSFSLSSNSRAKLGQKCKPWFKWAHGTRYQYQRKLIAPILQLIPGSLFVRVRTRCSYEFTRCSYEFAYAVRALFVRCSYAVRTSANSPANYATRPSDWGQIGGWGPCSLKRLSCPSISPAPRTTLHHGESILPAARTTRTRH